MATQKYTLLSNVSEYQDRYVPMFTYSNKIVYANNAAIAFFDVDNLAQLTNHRIEDFAPSIQPDGQNVSVKIDYVLTTSSHNDPANIRIQFVSKAKQYKYAEVTVLKLPELFLFVLHDITSYVQRENELRHRITRLERAITTGSDSVWQYNVASSTFFFYPSLYKMLGYKTNRSSITMDEFFDLAYDVDKPLVKEVFADFHSRNFQERFDEVRLRAADGRYIWFWFRGTLETIGIDGLPLIISGTTTNVQSKKETEEQLNNQNHEYLALNEELRMTNAELMEANARAEESDRLKTSFLENLSHELRTPMNGIMGFTDLLKDGTPDEDDKNMYIDIIRNSAKQLLGIVSDIMEISKIDTGQVSACMEKVNIFKTVNEVYKIIQKQAEHNRDIVFDFICATECRDIVIVSDEVKLKQIFTNLMNNAVKYTKRGYVRVRLAQDSGSIVFSVEDTGCGIIPENIPLIFRRFVRLKDSDNIGATSGAGLGLAIAKSYAELLGGTIDVKSEYGKGSVFTVRLPMKG